MKYLSIVLFLAFAIVLTSCKSSQVGSSGTPGTGKPGEKPVDNSAQAVFARELPNFRVTPEHTNDFERFDDVVREDPKQQKPSGPIASPNAITETIDYKLSQIIPSRRNIDKILGYRILVYSGTDVGQANRMVGELKNMFYSEADPSLPDEDRLKVAAVHFDYVAPNYIVKVGNYFSRMEAHHVFIQIKPSFPGAIVTSEAVDLKR